VTSPAHADEIEWTKAYHAGNKTFTGRRIFQAFRALKKACDEFAPKTVLDYGCGKGEQYAARDLVLHGLAVPNLFDGLGVDAVTPYDPGVPLFQHKPAGAFDAVVVIDVMEYVPAGDVLGVMEELFRYAKSLVFVNTSCVEPTKRHAAAEPWRRDKAFWLTRMARAQEANPAAAWVMRLGVHRSGTPRGSSRAGYTELPPVLQAHSLRFPEPACLDKK
jgi:SAM-dependent methyltransferase